MQTFPCGCKIVDFSDGSQTILYCSKHLAAPDIYEALKDAITWIRIASMGKSITLVDYEKLIAKADSKEG